MNLNAIFDAALRMSEAQQRDDELRRLRRVIWHQTRECGSCDKWMKSSQCPKEHNVAGMSRGPSSGDLKCGEYVQSDRAARDVADATAKLTEPTPPEREEVP